MSLLLALTEEPAASIAGGYSKTKKKYLVRHGGKLLVFTSPDQALNAIDRPAPVVEIEEDQATEQPEIELKPVKQWARVTGQIQQYNTAYNSQHWGQLLALFHKMREQDEDDIEMLLLA